MAVLRLEVIALLLSLILNSKPIRLVVKIFYRMPDIWHTIVFKMSEALGINYQGDMLSRQLISAQALFYISDNYTSAELNQETLAKTISCGTFTSAILIVNMIECGYGTTTSTGFGYQYVPYVIVPNMDKHAFTLITSNNSVTNSISLRTKFAGYTIETTTNQFKLYRYSSNLLTGNYIITKISAILAILS